MRRHHLLGFAAGFVVAYVASDWQRIHAANHHHYGRSPARQRHPVYDFALRVQLRFGRFLQRAGQCLGKQHRRQSVNSYVSIHGRQHQPSAGAEFHADRSFRYHGQPDREHHQRWKLAAGGPQLGPRRRRLRFRSTLRWRKPLRPALTREPSPSRPPPAAARPGNRAGDAGSQRGASTDDYPLFALVQLPGGGTNNVTTQPIQLTAGSQDVSFAFTGSPWITPNPPTGTVKAGQSLTVNVTVALPSSCTPSIESVLRHSNLEYLRPPPEYSGHAYGLQQSAAEPKHDADPFRLSDWNRAAGGHFRHAREHRHGAAIHGHHQRRVLAGCHANLRHHAHSGFDRGESHQARPRNLQRHSVVHGRWRDAIHLRDFERDQQSHAGRQRQPRYGLRTRSASSLPLRKPSRSPAATGRR